MREREKETLRYLGFRGQQADGQTLELMKRCFIELEQAAVPKHIYREYPLLVSGNFIDMTCMRTESSNLSTNLKNCDSVLLFAATLGSRVDVLLKKSEALQMSKAVIMQAAAAAMLEEYCDRENARIKEAYQRENRFLRPRFSPGYGDFSLECQREMAAVLELNKKIGITLTDSLLMVPTKSVTAVIGVSKAPGDCVLSGCESCGKTDCDYRRNGEGR